MKLGPDDIDPEVVNFSVVRKVNGTCAALRLAGFKPYILRTSVGKKDISKFSTIRKTNDAIVITIKGVDTGIRALSYILNIFISCYALLRLSKRIRPSIFIFWDFLPDTFIPAFISKIRFTSSIFVAFSSNFF